MAMTPRLDLRQTQTLVMTPQLQQAIKLLQLSNMDLSAFVEQQLESNPLLERVESQAAVADVVGAMETARGADGDVQGRSEGAIVDMVPGSASEAPVDQGFNTDRDEQGPSDAVGTQSDSEANGLSWSSSTTGSGGSFDDDGSGGLDAILSGDVSLRDHVDAQIRVDFTDPSDLMIAQYLLGMLDDNGWLIGSLETVVDALACDIDQVEQVLRKLQSMDPPGIFARNLKECLAAQLADRNRLDPAMALFLDHLDLLAKRDIAGLSKRCGVDREDIVDMISEIRKLDPKPGLRFAREPLQTVVPDVLMRPDPAIPGPEGGWIVELNTETLPKVLVNMRYWARIDRKSQDKNAKAFLTEQLQTANWLVKSLDQRANTILKVATEIVRRQDAFFAKGVRHLKPLILRDISEAIDMHESTVSRVTNSKYIGTPRGIFELKYFFTQAIAGSGGGEAHSAEAVRDRIRSLIDAEDPKAILSDDRIVEILKSDGVDIARRTVAKYRESMKIPSSIRRRREKSQQLA